MAAMPDRAVPGLVDLHHISAERLDAVLDEEIGVWRARMDWDFRASAELVRRFVRLRNLSGYALVFGDDIIGYSYFVCEDNKGLIGDLYVTRAHARADYEDLLLGAVLEALAATPFVHRVECQLLMLTNPLERRMPHPEAARVYRRNFMKISRAQILALAEGGAAPRLRFEIWTEGRQEESARLIARAYEGHIDSSINDQYRSIPGARRFLGNIIQYPGCGSFFAPASVVAFDATSGRVCGISLTSLVASDVGHITQVCVDPAIRGTGAGYELLRQSLFALARHGCRDVSLTVTTANEDAVRLYDRMGFRTLRQFTACVWESL
jgi:ribosomal protein S18 acetylase RimI-like enzyme